jgi:putative transposase
LRVPGQVKAKQLGLVFRTWGGKRRGAGAKHKGPRRRVAHKKRPILKRRFPLHVTVRMRDDVCRLRNNQCFKVLTHVFQVVNARIGFRVVHYSIQGNHVHLLVEADATKELSRGMQGLNGRMATALNRLMHRNGKVLADRYHAVILRTPTQTAHALHYVLNNRQHHAPGLYAADWRDPFASAEAPLVAPRTWLLRSVESGRVGVGIRQRG